MGKDLHHSYSSKIPLVYVVLHLPRLDKKLNLVKKKIKKEKKENTNKSSQIGTHFILITLSQQPCCLWKKEPLVVGAVSSKTKYTGG